MKRIPFLDATRGLLACVVVAHHALLLGCGSAVLDGAARFAVSAFFVMSGYVLALAYDGRPGAFVLRRVVRLWPLFAVCVLIGHAQVGTAPTVAELVWSPTFHIEARPADLPTWTLFMEAWASLFLLPMFAVARLNRWLACIMPVGCLFLVLLDPRLWFVALFALGVAGSGFTIPWPPRVPAWAEWLGKISFSLYLTHWLVLTAFGVWGVALVLPVAWAAWWAIERPSIAWSRRVGRRTFLAQPLTFS